MKSSAVFSRKHLTSSEDVVDVQFSISPIENAASLVFSTVKDAFGPATPL